ncbi:MAG: 2-succinyl-5-enolpyruvyl-6-hydroxy-3-cyclohexene-1-carboxylic-acid synthase [Propionibacteriaceae bacterium]|jgi:2-succinyl-5-enolpyruvyl-6-hydroxy-3-cyclohexene-1-carboxylate synthase|nr:2-succinyl-5-enolpyruvyl-6-hydroxy-3-cyclohexene-1-carboxylic-acid synthase [Propionibacteriaceae bacterium]
MDDLLTTPPAPSVLAGAVVIDELAALGVTDIVCCPGSRSAPLAYAAAAAEQRGGLRLHMRLDERGAAFYALGIAKATNRAVAVVTTSGTAVANLAPALAEARYARVPLIAVTADRPATLLGTGANQTADQVGIFGPLPLAVIRIAAHELKPQAWRSALRRAVVTAEGRLTLRPGPVHVNVELGEPLVGEPGPLPPGVPFRVTAQSPPWAVSLDPGRRTVIVAGDLPPDTGRWWAEAAERAQIPLLAEPSSNARRGGAAIAGYRYLLPGFAPAVERVVVAGHPTLSRPVMALLGRTDAEIIAVDASGEWPDPGWAVSQVVPAVALAPGDPKWLDRWTGADRRFRRHVEADPDWSGEAVAARVLRGLGERDALVLGSSSPVRDADLAPIQARPPAVYANRGLAGIDGLIATTTGVAAGRGQPVVGLIGDLTALHDVSSLARPRFEPEPAVTLVVADDQGGSIFTGLEMGAPRSQIGELAEHAHPRVDIRHGRQAGGVLLQKRIVGIFRAQKHVQLLIAHRQNR